MIVPEFLKKEDWIGIVSPAGKIDYQAVKPGLNMLQESGYRLLEGANVANSWNQFSATDQQRLDDFQLMIDHPEVKAIICARGGYGSVRILSHLDWSAMKNHPKWVVGFSDITAFHSLLASQDVASIHAAMPGSYYDSQNQPSQSFLLLEKALRGEQLQTTIRGHKMNRFGEVMAPLVGGNLSILYSLSGTPYDLDTRGKILVIEDLNEQLYHLDRMMMNMKLSGKLDHLAGLIVGGFTNMKDNDTPFGKSAYEIIHEYISEYNYPVCFGYPVGHQEENYPLILGKDAQLGIDSGEVVLTQNIQ